MTDLLTYQFLPMKIQLISNPIPSFLIVVLFQATAFSQQAEEIALLYNTKPVLALVNDSAEIVEVVKPLPGYMEGYTLVTPDYAKKINEEARTAASSGGYSIISSEYFVIPFDEGFAVLEDEAVKVLDELLMQLKEDPGKSLLLSVYNESLHNNLYKNRINAIKSYLKIEGLSLNRFKLNYLEGAASQDEFKVNFIQ